jgi:purine nucleosidase
MTTLVHLDTDLGGDIDDLCALALLCAWPGVELTGVTVVGDTGGRRAGYTRYALNLAGHGFVPLAAGADTADGYYPYELGLPPESRYWPAPIPPQPTPPAEALALLAASIQRGARIVAIGPLTNLALLERQRPGLLAQADLTIMGGYLYAPRAGYPAWGNADDFNIQVDVASARTVLESCRRATLVPLSITLETALRWAHLPALRQAGPLAQRIAQQAEAFAHDERLIERLGPTSPALPRDLINFQHDPLACAIALGWQEGVTYEECRLSVTVTNGILMEIPDPAGRPFRLVTCVDGPRFNQFWLDVVCRKESDA